MSAYLEIIEDQLNQLLLTRLWPHWSLFYYPFSVRIFVILHARYLSV